MKYRFSFFLFFGGHIELWSDYHPLIFIPSSKFLKVNDAKSNNIPFSHILETGTFRICSGKKYACI